MIWLKACAVWCAILPLALANGVLREKALVPVLGARVGLAASGLVLCACILLVAAATAPWYGPLALRQCWLVGALWVLLTLAFEFGIGFASDRTWSEMLEAYTFRGGNLWPVVLAVTLVSPWAAARVRGIL